MSCGHLLAPSCGCAAPVYAPPAAAKPIVKWVGGKTKLLPALLARIPKRFNRYYEPFAGGAALFFKLAPERAVLADVNEGLVNVYRAVASNVDAVIDSLEWHARYHSDTYYYMVREDWNRQRGEWRAVHRAAAFLYLNRTCFNGLWRVNKSGEMNVPMGRYANPRICAPDLLRAAAHVLARAEVRCMNYLETVADASPGDFVYFDPPYDPVTPTANFTAYSAGGFGADDQRQLAEAVHDLVRRGVYVLASNSDTPLVRSLYAGLQIDVVSAPRAINSDASKRGGVSELIVVGRPTLAA